MVWIIALLAVTNMAIGFAVAIFLYRKGTLCGPAGPLASTPQAAPVQAAVPPIERPQADADQLTAQAPEADAPPLASEAPAPRAPVAAEPIMEEVVAEAGLQSTEVNEAPSEDNVLAGIEAFRSQLAKMSKTVVEDDSEAELEEELAQA